MIKHIVLYTIKDGEDKDAVVKCVAGALKPLVGKIPGLLHLEVCRCFGGMDYALYSEFESRQALEDYQRNPLHLAAKETFHHFLDSRVSGDYEIEV